MEDQVLPNYHIVLHNRYTDVSGTLLKLSGHSNAIVCYEHTGEGQKRTHVHVYVEGMSVSTDTLKNWIKKELNVTSYKKSDWAFMTQITKGDKKGQPVDREAITYFHKGKYPRKYVFGITDAEVDSYESKSFAPTEQSKIRWKEVFETNQEKVKRKCDLIKIMCAEYSKEYTAWDLYKAIKVVVTCLKKHPQSSGINKFVVRNYVEWLQSELYEDTFVDQLHNMMFGR